MGGDGIFRGLCLTGSACLLGYFLSKAIPIGWVSSSIVIGFLITNIAGFGKSFRAGVDFSEKHILTIAIILLGSQVDFSILFGLGLETLVLIVFIVSFAVTFGYFIGPIFKVSRGLSLLIGVGTGVCGASAIATASKTLGSSKEDTGLSIALVNAIGSIGIVIMPALALGLDLDNSQAGVLIGGSLQAVGQVTAAGFAINNEVGEIATVVKLGRVLLLGPLIIVLGLFFSGNKDKGVGVPPFIVGFFIMMLAANLNLFNASIGVTLSFLTKFSLAFAMASIGLKIRVGDVRGKGFNAFACASSIFVIQVTICLIITSILI